MPQLQADPVVGGPLGGGNAGGTGQGSRSPAAPPKLSKVMHSMIEGQVEMNKRRPA